MPRVGFEPTISAGERPKTYALDRTATHYNEISSLETHVSMTSGPSRSTFSANYADTWVVLNTLIDVVLHLTSDTCDGVNKNIYI